MFVGQCGSSQVACMASNSVSGLCCLQGDGAKAGRLPATGHAHFLVHHAHLWHNKGVWLDVIGTLHALDCVHIWDGITTFK